MAITWERFSAFVTGKHSWVVGLLIVLLGMAVVAAAGSGGSEEEAPNSLPDTAESARINDYLADFPDADTAAAILVVSREDGSELTDGDRQVAVAARERMLSVDRATALRSTGPPAIVSPDRKALIASVPVSSEISGFALRDTVDQLRAAAARELPPGLIIHVTGGPAFAADIANSFSGANFTLLAVTALVVALLLVLTYRSPILWLVPLITVGVADRVANAGATLLTHATGLDFDGSTSGITSVLVFGAGTNYALLLISRYREELVRHADHRAALAVAVRRSGPAMLASNLTVVLALLTLVFATLPSTRGLGVSAACGLLIAAMFALGVLPPALSLFGRKVFWPFIPRYDEKLTETRVDVHADGVWHRLATVVVSRPKRSLAAAVVVLAVCACGVLGISTGLSQTEQFRVNADSVSGLEVLSDHFPAGQGDATTVVARTDSAEAVDRVLGEVEGVQAANQSGTSPSGFTRWNVVLEAPPASAEAFESIIGMRARLATLEGANALVGGSDARAFDTRNAADRDRSLIIPLVLMVVLIVLFVLLRSVLAPVLLALVAVFSTVAALGLGTFVGTHLFGFPALDDNTVLFAFLFLTALGVDYTIFLVTRAREECEHFPVEPAMIRAIAATGGVITSAGIVLAAVFAVLGVLPLITLTQLGIIVGLGIILDTFIVRTVVVPSMFALVGPKIWWPNVPGQTVGAQDSAYQRS